MKLLIQIVAIFLCLQISFAASNKDCLTTSQTTCDLDEGGNMTLSEIITILQNTNIKTINFQDNSKGSTGNRYLKDNSQAIADEIKTHTHYTKFSVEFLIAKGEESQDYVSFINKFDNQKDVVYNLESGKLSDHVTVFDTIDFNVPISKYVQYMSNEIYLPENAFTNEQWNNYQEKVNAATKTANNIDLQLGWYESSAIQPHIQFQTSVNLLQTFSPPHITLNEDQMIQYILNFIKPNNFPTQTQEFIIFSDFRNQAIATIASFFVVKNIENDKTTYSYSFLRFQDRQSPIDPNFQSKINDFVDKVAYPGNKIDECDDYDYSEVDGKIVFTCKDNKPPRINTITVSDCTNGKPEKHVEVNSQRCIKEAQLQECYRYMGQLQDPQLSSDPTYKEVDTVCTTDTWNNQSSIKITLTYNDWKLSAFTIPSGSSNQTPYTENNINDCLFSRALYASKECNYGETNCNTKSDGNFKQLGSEWGIETPQGNAGSSEQFNTVYFQGDSGFIHLNLADLTSGNIDFCYQNQVLSESTGDFVFKCYFAEEIYMYGVPQHVYAFDVQVTIDRNTSASKSLDVTKTLVKGNCCQNSLGVTSQLHFCSLDNGPSCTKGVNDLQSVARNSQYYLVWSLLNDVKTQALKDLVLLFPDLIKIGPFLPDWEGFKEDTARDQSSTYWEAGPHPSTFIIKVQSNVAFTASVRIAGRIWDVTQYGPGKAYPHTCFIKDGKNDPAGCTPIPASNRRILQDQSSQFGTPQSQLEVSSNIVFTEENNNNITNEQNKKKDNDDDSNVVLIAVVASLAVVIIIGGIAGGIYCVKSKNQQKLDRQQNYEVKKEETNA